MEKMYDVIVIGAGHAGCEAAFAAARLGKRVLMVTINLDSIAYLACNPAIGGTAKAHLVCEIDALGGLMGMIADKTALQFRMLNSSKGAAVFSLRAQTDNIEYPKAMRKVLESTQNICVRQAEVARIITDKKRVTGIELTTGEVIGCDAVVVAAGVYLDSKIYVGKQVTCKGPAGFANSMHLTKSLVELGIEVRRFKTGTPPRVNYGSLDLSKTIPQPGDTGIQTFSALTKKPIKNVIICHLTYTNPTTHKIINDNIHLSAMHRDFTHDDPRGIGARYCPSIEDKITRFPERENHQLFLEPESLHTDEVYVQGFSTSLPNDVQVQMVRSIAGMENAEIMRGAYAIEYNSINSLQLKNTLEYKGCDGLFFAGQVNGTSGYEEAAAQGLVAGANAAGANLILPRTQSYIGVLIDDLVTVGTNEPYRMFTSRAEHRLYLRQDNADARLTPIGRKTGLVDDNRWRIFKRKMNKLDVLRGTITQKMRADIHKGKLTSLEGDIGNTVFTEIKYAGYLARENARIAEAKRQEATLLPPNIDYMEIKGLRTEAREKLTMIRPHNIASATRISGVTPADINVLLVYLKKNR